MALLQISEPGLSAAPHQRRLAAGIDLGTTNSLVATVRSGQAETLPDHQGRYLLPSVVNYHASGLTVGYDARLNAAQDPANTISSVKRMMGRSLADIQNRYPHLPYQLQASENGLPMIQTAGGLLNPIRVSADLRHRAFGADAVVVIVGLQAQRVREHAPDVVGGPFAHWLWSHITYFHYLTKFPKHYLK